jgi:hypothetical protein
MTARTMPLVPDHSAELALLGCVLLNVAVFGSAWRFAAGRVTASRSQASLDAGLLGYAIQYAAIGLPGVVGMLRPTAVVAVALALSAALFAMSHPRDTGLRPVQGAFGWRNRWFSNIIGTGRRPVSRSDAPLPAAHRAVVVALATFTLVVVAGFAYFQSDLPVVFNDALTYHFPAAAQWLQQGRITLFPTWFFNPANGYSPLAGSTFVAWLIVPFGSDVLARYVQVPALLGVGIGVYRLGRQLSAAPVAAAAVAAAAVLCRPLFMASLTGKDDLFVAFTFVAAVVALAPGRAAEPFGAVRLGLAIGLLLATKYTALLALPMLLLAIDGPARAGWRIGRWTVALVVAAALAGPWYLRNWITTGNPLFPLDVSLAGLHLFRGLFTTARSDALSSIPADARVVLGGSYGVPVAVAVLAIVGWAAAAVLRIRQWPRDPLLRACVLGPPIGLALFAWRSPFPEVRFVFPVLLLLTTSAISAWPRRGACFAFALPIAAIATISVSKGWAVFGPLVFVAAIAAVVVAGIDAATRSGPRWRRGVALAVPTAALAMFAFVRWSAFCRAYPDHWTEDDPFWSLRYPEQPLWKCVNQQAPDGATVAYADLTFVYPLQGSSLRRRIGYAPTRRGVRMPTDLPWLGAHLSGEALVAAADGATVADPDPLAWRDNLRRLGAQYLVVGHAIPRWQPIEATWAAADPGHFRPLYVGPAGWVFAVQPGS